MTAAPDFSFLDWHQEWVVDHAQDRAAAAYLQMLGLPDHDARDERGLVFWERAGLALADEVSFGMTEIEAPEFVERARHAAVEVFLRRLHQIVATASAGGRA